MDISSVREMQDDELLSEIQLVSELMVAAEASPTPLAQRIIDQVLGLVDPPTAASA